MLTLKICLLESVPKHIAQITNVSRALQPRLMQIYKNIDDKKALSSIFTKALKSIYVDIVVHVSDEQQKYGTHKEKGKIIIYVLHDDIKNSMSNVQSWVNLLRQISTTISHELIHDWQSDRRNRTGGRRNRESDNVKKYMIDMEEVVAFANDVINDIGMNNAKLFVSGRLTSYQLLQMSQSFSDFIYYIDLLNPKQKDISLKRLYKTIALMMS